MGLKNTEDPYAGFGLVLKPIVQGQENTKLLFS